MKPLVSLARCADYAPEKIKNAVEQTLAPFGGMAALVKRGDRVLLKPNLVMPMPAEKAGNTHPAVVRAVAELLRDCGATVLAGDSPGLGTARKVAAACGILEAVEGAGGKLIEFTADENSARPRSGLLAASDLAREIRDCDLVINLPKFKTHGLAILTLGVKNCFGAVVGARKFQWHHRAGHNSDLFCKMLVEAWQAVRPGLTIMDAVVGMEGLGPTAGTPKQIGFIAAAKDTLALDAFCTRVAGVEPLNTPVLRAAKDMFPDCGWFEPELSGGTLDEFKLANFKLPEARSFQELLPRWLAGGARKLLTAKPVPAKGRCVGCGVCAKVCPAQVIELRDKFPHIREDECIRCYCCHELCPHHAFDLSMNWAGRMFERFIRRR